MTDLREQEVDDFERAVLRLAAHRIMNAFPKSRIAKQAADLINPDVKDSDE